MSVADLKDLLAENELDASGKKADLIARLEENEIEAPSEKPTKAKVSKAKGKKAAAPKAKGRPKAVKASVSEASEEEEEEVEVKTVKKTATKPKAAKKTTAKPKASKKAGKTSESEAEEVVIKATKKVSSKATKKVVAKASEEESSEEEELPKKVVKKVSKKETKKAPEPEASEEDVPSEEEEREFPVSVKIPKVTYCLSAEQLLKSIIFEAIVDVQLGVSDEKILQRVIGELKGFVVPSEPTKKPEKLKVSFDEKLGAHTDARGLWVFDKKTQGIFAKVSNAKVVPLEEEDLSKLVGFKLWHVVSDPKREKGKLATKDEIAVLLKENRPPSKEEPPKVVKASVSEASEESEDEASEGDDEGDEIETPAKSSSSSDAVSRTEQGIAEVTKKREPIDEATFYKFVQAQNSEGINRADHVAISKKAGLSIDVGEEILLSYKSLNDMYPKVVPDVLAKKAPAKVPFGTRTLATEAPKRKLLNVK